MAMCFCNQKEKKIAPLEIETPKNRDCYFILKSKSTRYNDMKFYGRAGLTVSLDVPLGEYELYYATGDTWYGTKHLFGEDTVYQKCDAVLEFTTEDGYVWGHTLTLYSVSGGNMDTVKLSEEDFPQ